MSQKRNEENIDTKKQSRVEVSDYHAVPLYRSYGVTKREYPLLNKIKQVLHRITAGLIVLPMCCVLLLGLVMTCIFGGPLAIFIYLPISILIIFKLTRSQRKRRTFLRKLKKLVKREGYELSFKRGFFRSFSWSPKTEDFILTTPHYSYRMYLFNARKYNSELLFESRNKFLYIRRPIKNIFSLIFTLDTKITEYSFTPDAPVVEKGKKHITGIIANPTCSAMSYKEHDGTTAPTGSGGEVFGYYIFTGSGFIDTVELNEKYEN